MPTGKDWGYFKIPANTDLPPGLAIVKDEYNPRFDATHYTIAPAYDMSLQQFRGLLEQLIQNVLKKVA